MWVCRPNEEPTTAILRFSGKSSTVYVIHVLAICPLPLLVSEREKNLLATVRVKLWHGTQFLVLVSIVSFSFSLALDRLPPSKPLPQRSRFQIGVYLESWCIEASQLLHCWESLTHTPLRHSPSASLTRTAKSKET